MAFEMTPLLQEVSNEQARAKVGAFGRQGSGKTTTLALLAIGVSKTYHNGAPVAMMDTENGSDYLKPVFDKEGVKLLVVKSGAFADMVPVLRQAQEKGCCAFIMDSVTHTWTELKRSYSAAMARKYNISDYDLQFQDWDDIKGQWASWTNAFLNSPLHCFIAGRAGNEYEYVVNDKGKRELVKGDSKMKTEGEFGYEPNLLIEMEAERRKTTKKHTGGSFVHFARVLKDRARSLNGKSFEFVDINDYKPGDYKKVFDVFAPHFAFLNISATQRAIGTNSSEDLFDGTGDTEYRRRNREKQIALDEILATMQLLWPGQSAADKALRIRVMETIWGARAWSAIEAMSLERVLEGLEALRAYEKQSKAAQGAETENGVLELLKASLAAVTEYPALERLRHSAPPISPAVSKPNGDGTLPIRKETPINLPAIPSTPIVDEADLEIFYAPTANSTIHLTGDVVHISKTLKQVFQARGSKKGSEYSWDMPASHFEGLQGLCEKTGIKLSQVGA
jgi:hypothetical protein